MADRDYITLTPKIDPDTGLQLEVGPFEIFGPSEQGWQVLSWDKKWKPTNVGTFLTIFEAHAAMAAAQRSWLALQPAPVVYFIGTGLDPASGRIKVGHTLRLKDRLSALQTASSELLTVFASVSGSRDLEQRYHQRWKNYRLQGEWFRPGRPILAEIARLNSSPVHIDRGEVA